MQRFATVLLLSAMFLPTLGDTASAQQERSERLLGGNENPPVISDGSGSFRVRFEGDSATFRLRYDVASEGSDVTQAHWHISNPGTNGGIVVWFCANPPIVPPVEVPECPPSPADLTGDIVAADVQAVVVEEEGEPPVEIIAAGDLEGLQRLIEQSSVYVNVHSDNHPSGEVRGQMNPRRR
jgi:CHRD domain